MSLINKKRVLDISDLLKSEKTLQASKRYADKFDKWMVDNSKSFENLENDGKITIILDFFKSIMNDYKGSTLWTISSLLKNHFIKLNVVLDNELINTFLKARSKVLIVGYFGALRSSEIHSLKRNDLFLSRDGKEFVLQFIRKKTDHSGIGQTVLVPFFFGPNNEVNLKNIIIEYFSLTSHLKPDSKLFSLYDIRGHKYKNQPMGIHTIQLVPQDIACSTNLDDPLLYTSHSLRVSAATALAEKGATALQLQMFGGWKSIAVAEGYIRESAKTKKDIALLLSSNATSKDTATPDAATPDAASKEAIQDPPADLVLDEPKTPTKIKQSFVNNVQSTKTHSPTKIMGSITNKTIYINNGNGGIVYL
ncbi:hypothetical protein ACTFIZ_002322 [Dictyostelium cf. discoideum]